MRTPVAFLLSVLVLAACQTKGPEPDATLPDQASMAADGLTGTVVERLNASPYTYLRLKTIAGEAWAAVPESAIEPGALVTVANPILMSDFESTALQRTFAEVYFGTLTAAGGDGGLPAGHPDLGTARERPPVTIGPVAKAEGREAHTVAELWAQQSDLEGKPVTVRGVVVKYNPGVMGKNWLHLQDGTGDPASGTNDITVTTQHAAALGDTLTVTGTLRRNLELGSGYSFPLIVEDAAVAKR